MKTTDSKNKTNFRIEKNKEITVFFMNKDNMTLRHEVDTKELLSFLKPDPKKRVKK